MFSHRFHGFFSNYLNYYLFDCMLACALFADVTAVAARSKGPPSLYCCFTAALLMLFADVKAFTACRPPSHLRASCIHNTYTSVSAHLSLSLARARARALCLSVCLSLALSSSLSLSLSLCSHLLHAFPQHQVNPH